MARRAVASEAVPTWHHRLDTGARLIAQGEKMAPPVRCRFLKIGGVIFQLKFCFITLT